MKKLFFFYGILFAAIFCQPAVAEVPTDEEDPYFILMGEADKAIKDNDLQTAVLRLKEALRVDPSRPTNSLLLSNLGMVYSRMGYDSLAIVTLDRALELAPSMTTVLVNRGKLHLKSGNDEEAYSDFSRAIARDSLCLDARYYHGVMALYGGQAGIAETDFAVLLDNDPDAYNTQAALGALYQLTGRDREAIPYYKKLIERDPAAEYYAALAGCYLAVSELSDAAETIAAGLKRYDKDPELYYYRARLNHASYLLDQARRDAELAIRYGADPKKVNAIFSSSLKK